MMEFLGGPMHGTVFERECPAAIRFPMWNEKARRRERRSGAFDEVKYVRRTVTFPSGRRKQLLVLADRIA